MTTPNNVTAMDTRAGRQLADAGAAAGALPAISADMMVAALGAYRDLQHKLDAAMPEQIMELEGKPFRKKGYWRAVALAFNLDVQLEKEERIVTGTFLDGRENFGWLVTYRASHPSGRTQPGDGACFAVEKARRFKCPHPEREGSRRTLHFPHSSCPDFDPNFSWRTLPGEATEHNVRGHAHTRAYNRAVSNLVGFGEVSAEEVEQDDQHAQGAQQASQAPAGSGRTAPAQAQATQPSGAPQAAPGAAQPTAQLPPGCTYVKKVTPKKGTNTRGPWTNYRVEFDDGRIGSTFSDTLGGECTVASKAPRIPVNPDLAPGKKEGSWDLLKLLPIPAAAPAPHVDEPVTGPEPVLTVRKVTTDQGPRWVIQTAKRQLATDKEAHADLAVQARKDAAGIVPTFKVVGHTAEGVAINRLTDVRVEPMSGAKAPEREVGQEG
jgi:hypothetical protein